VRKIPNVIQRPVISGEPAGTIAAGFALALPVISGGRSRLRPGAPVAPFRAALAAPANLALRVRGGVSPLIGKQHFVSRTTQRMRRT